VAARRPSQRRVASAVDVRDRQHDILKRAPEFRGTLEQPRVGDGPTGRPGPGRQPLFATVANPVDIVARPDGDLYYVSITKGQVRRIAYGAATACAAGNYLAQYYANQTWTGTPALARWRTPSIMIGAEQSCPRYDTDRSFLD